MNDTAEKADDQIIRVRAPSITILEAQLVASPPERVLKWLQDRAAEDAASAPATDADLEAALLARKEPLINLGLAEYGIQDESISTLFESSDPVHRRALRLAVLSNQALKRLQPYHSGDLVQTLAGRRTSIGEWLTQLSDEELQALFSNPTLSDDFLIDFLEQKKGWQELDDPRHRLVIESLTKNPRMVAHYQSVIMSGYAEYKHSAVFAAGWRLALAVPVTVPWCWVLGGLYSKLSASGSSLEDPMTAIERWAPDPSELSLCEMEQESHARGGLGPFAQVRQQLARLLIAKSDGLKVALAHGDLGVRAAGYQYGRLTAEQFEAAVAKDPGQVFEVVVRNEWLWRKAQTRELLKQLAWAQPDPHSYMDAPNTYRYQEAEYRKSHPEWFTDEEEPESADEDTLPVTRGAFNEAMTELTGQVQLPYVNIANTEGSVLRLLARSRWLAGAVVLTLVLVLYLVISR